MTPITDAILTEATRRLVEKFHPVRVILFGSRARGTASDRSDADFLVLCDDITPEDYHRIVTEMYNAMAGLKLPCDIVLMTPQEFEIDKEVPGTVARPASREGKVLYERAA